MIKYEYVVLYLLGIMFGLGIALIMLYEKFTIIHGIETFAHNYAIFLISLDMAIALFIHNKLLD